MSNVCRSYFQALPFICPFVVVRWSSSTVRISSSRFVCFQIYPPLPLLSALTPLTHPLGICWFMNMAGICCVMNLPPRSWTEFEDIMQMPQAISALESVNVDPATMVDQGLPP